MVPCARPHHRGCKAADQSHREGEDNSRSAAVKFKQMEAQARKQQQQRQQGAGPLGGGDSIVGGPVKMPQGAL